MGKKRRVFTKEFKNEAVRLIVEEGRRISELSRGDGDVDSADHHEFCDVRVLR
jgi:transposase-like protein